MNRARRERGMELCSMRWAPVSACCLVVACVIGLASAQVPDPVVFVTAQESPLVDPMEDEVSLGWSLLFRGVNYTQVLDDAVTECYDSMLAQARSNDETKLESFTPVAFFNYTQPIGDGLMIQYFTNVNHRAETDAGELIVAYTNDVNDGLASCANDNSFTLTINPTLIADGGHGLFASAAEWIIGCVAGGLILALFLGTLWFMLKGRKKTYDIAEYADEKEYDSD
mmetsp:Transcript_11886/g.25816  ORF Transcript_11886/g.25816 Transcript_11886/m.25816 type:complete len:226 (+) Transcript_11886:188-865(+)|eukprot:CAMPEP_0185846126 /NCGR_PEP_ID=MMETSP1354-20130828/1863_1 /TAXON_ID=708628 /ORGANISM="Erythrolobus madagascarensis, Strain CCMP3276" /LENGTH=225 /DNA_ID=CAMNT_0028546213 /DNA_START=158 /DNA_END=835 /DNA_ORIENTATION=-